MQKKTYPMIISDFDGTLLRSDYTIAKETISAISRYVEGGGIFAIITGRGISSILPIAKKIGLKGIIAGMQGGVIVDIQSGKPLVDLGLHTKSAVKVLQKLEKLDLHLHIYDLERFYSNKEDVYLEVYEKATGTKGIVVNEPLSSFIQKQPFQTKKILAMVKEEERKGVFEYLKEDLPEGLEVVYSGAYLVEVISKEFNKGTAVEFFSKYYQIPLENILCVGDNYNDLPMLQLAGKGLAVKNCDEAVKEKIEIYRYSNDENAIGHIIEEYGLRKE